MKQAFYFPVYFRARIITSQETNQMVTLVKHFILVFFSLDGYFPELRSREKERLAISYGSPTKNWKKIHWIKSINQVNKVTLTQRVIQTFNNYSCNCPPAAPMKNYKHYTNPIIHFFNEEKKIETK